MIDNEKKVEKFITVIAIKKQDNEKEAWESLDELKDLIKTAGGEVIMGIVQKVEKIHAGYYIGSGKIEEIKELIKIHDAAGVVFDDELSPIQLRNLTDEFQVKVMDRTKVILDIFASRASSKEGKLQVEMAQLKYNSTRLIGFGAMLSRQGGGSSGGGENNKGAGETKLELDKRKIRARIDILENELKEIERHRKLIRDRREKDATPIVALVGYTNAGKSTLLNQLSGSDICAKDELFATLDPTTRKVELPGGKEILLTDTVGFIRKLPHHLVKAFHSTLEEAKYADVILHVMDASSDQLATHQKVVYETLNKLKIEGIPIIAVYNKLDKVEEDYPRDEVAEYEAHISAKDGKGCEELLETIEQILYTNMQSFTIEIPYSEAAALKFCHDYGEKLQEEYTNNGIKLSGYIPNDKYYKITQWLV